VRANHVVLAGNVYLGSVARRLADTLVPITAYTGVTKPLGYSLKAAIGFSGAISDSRYANYHYRIVGGDRLMWTGGASTRPGGGAGMKRKLERSIQSIYPQFERVEFESFWSGEMGFAIHRMPQIGQVQPGVWLASAFGAQGLNTSAVAGDLIARAIVEGDDRWRLFLPYELVWAGGRTGRAVVETSAWWWNQREAVTARVARRREELHRRRLQEEGAAVTQRPAYREVEAVPKTTPPPEAPGNPPPA